MTKEIAKKQKCLLLRNGARIWLDEEKTAKIEQILLSIESKAFIRVERRIINTADCSGLYLPEDLEEIAHRNNGEWQCKYGYWHKRFDKCTYDNCPAYQKAFPRHN